MNNSSHPVGIIKFKEEASLEAHDWLATEEPLEIRIVFGGANERLQKSISVTMRTPGNDFELAAGFLFTEGIIKNAEDIKSIKYCDGVNENIAKIELKENITIEFNNLERNFYTSSSCGVCGKSSIAAIKTVCRLENEEKNVSQISPAIIYALPDILKKGQDVFGFTGGLHACGLFDYEGRFLLSREDVGRHNALDKLVGAALQQSMVPLRGNILLLSGRASFELIQKAWMAGITTVAAIGAPSSLAVEMADEAGITLIGFLRNRSFNIYSNAHRIMNIYENSDKG